MFPVYPGDPLADGEVRLPFAAAGNGTVQPFGGKGNIANSVLNFIKSMLEGIERDNKVSSLP